MLGQAIDLYSADAVRFACADAGITLEDANFEQKRPIVPWRCICRRNLRTVLRDPTVGKKDQLLLRDGELSYFVDRAFKNESAL